MTDDLAPPPSVSVVIPTHERRVLVQRAITSVLAQTVRDWELIVVDDGSTDGTREAVAGMGLALTYVRQENRGVSAARNAGIARARGTVVAFLDSDDQWLPHHLAVCLEVFARHPAAVLCSTSPRFEVGGNQAPAAAAAVDALPLMVMENVVGNPSSVAVRRDALVAVAGFEERLRVMEGWDLWLRLAALGPFVLLEHRTIVMHPTRGSLTATSATNGEYLRTLGVMGERVAAVAARVGDRPDATALRTRAEGMRAYLQALHAIGAGDRATARTRLAAACAASPELSREPQLVANRLALLRFGPAERLASFATAAELWPEPGADTALYLRFHAIALAARLGHGATAARLLHGWPLGATPRFLAGNAAVFARLLRQTFRKRRSRSRRPS